MRGRLTQGALGLLAACWAVGAWAQSGATATGAMPSMPRAGNATSTSSVTPATPTMAAGAVARSDRKFMREAAGGGLFEVQASQLAASKSGDEAVKRFAAMLVEHHTAVNNELKQLAAAKGVELPAEPPGDKRRLLDKLGKQSGAEFDREYVREVGLKDHEKDIKAFEKASKDARDPQLKAFVDKTLPVLREHLAQAQKLPQAARR